jgi:hypothetical protein
MLHGDAILDVPLTSVLKPEIALALQQMLRLYTLGNLLEAWHDSREQRRIEQLFDSSEQAHHAVSVCATWVGFDVQVLRRPMGSDPWRAGDIVLSSPMQLGAVKLDGLLS